MCSVTSATSTWALGVLPAEDEAGELAELAVELLEEQPARPPMTRPPAASRVAERIKPIVLIMIVLP
jgi:hypothetical protein